MPIDTPSAYQQAIFDYIRDGKGHLVVKAVAGGSKTTTAIESLRYVAPDKRVLFMAYNKAIANTLQLRVPENVRASTFHSQGFRIVKQMYPQAEMQKDKVYGVMQDLSRARSWRIPDGERTAFFNRIERIVNLMRLTLRTSSEEADLLCSEFDVDNEDEESTYAMDTFRRVDADTSTFDFADMVYIPGARPFRGDQYDLIYIDEFQDCTEAQYRMARKLLTPQGRLVVIGDPFQSIYAYLGAEPRLFQEVMKEPNTISLPLSISYRCSRAVVAHAKKLVPEIEAHPAAKEGAVIKEGSIHNVRDGDFVLCRVNLPLVKLALQLIGDGKKATINGSDIGRNLATFIKPYAGVSISEMESKLGTKRRKLMEKMMTKFPDRSLDDIPEYQRFIEKVMTIQVLAQDADTVEEVMERIQDLFSDDLQQGIVLSTVHKAKGLEAENVFILEPQLIPFPYGVEQDWQKEQERNIDYVARTRAINRLEYITDCSFFKQKRVGRTRKTGAETARTSVPKAPESKPSIRVPREWEKAC